MKTPTSFIEALSCVELENTFNPYRDICPIHDAPDAVHTRKNNLLNCIEAALNAQADTIWIARDLGYRGGRRTGIPLTDEAHLDFAEDMFGGVSLDRATEGPILAERTATVTWKLLSDIGKPVMLWNIFPLHPHAENSPMTNRCHKKNERLATWPFLLALIDMLNPKQLVAIGRDAGLALSTLDVPVSMVRHPSYGGQAEFIDGIQKIYNIQNSPEEASTSEMSFAAIA